MPGELRSPPANLSSIHSFSSFLACCRCPGKTSSNASRAAFLTCAPTAASISNLALANSSCMKLAMSSNLRSISSVTYSMTWPVAFSASWAFSSASVAARSTVEIACIAACAVSSAPSAIALAELAFLAAKALAKAAATFEGDVTCCAGVAPSEAATAEGELEPPAPACEDSTCAEASDGSASSASSIDLLVLVLEEAGSWRLSEAPSTCGNSRASEIPVTPSVDAATSFESELCWPASSPNVCVAERLALLLPPSPESAWWLPKNDAVRGLLVPLFSITLLSLDTVSANLPDLSLSSTLLRCSRKFAQPTAPPSVL
mmetsp:Transcript_21416/g.54102  ORF Transcript_21416/g.54102 Transcript_21416/m.54102 type:complete len:317 (-) Transcript_21416:195-1145(-)